MRHATHFLNLVRLGVALFPLLDSISYGDTWAAPAASARPRLIEITGLQTDTGRSETDGITQTTQLALTGRGPVGQLITLSHAGVGQIGTTTVDAHGRWTFDYTVVALPAGLHRFQVEENQSRSAPFTVVIDTASPTAPVIERVGSFPLVISGTSEPGSEISVKIDGHIPVGNCFTENDGTWRLVYTIPISPGSHSFSAAATDAAGNVSEDSSAIFFDSRITPPIIVSAKSDTGIMPNSSTTSAPTLSLSGTAVAGSTISINREGYGLIGTTTADSQGSWTFDYTKTNLPDNVHRFTATATTDRGTSLSSTVFIVRVDTLSPTVVAISRQDPAIEMVTGAAAGLTFRVEFSEDVVGVTPRSFLFTTTGSITAQIARLHPISGSTYDVALNALKGEGTLRLDLSAAAAGVIDFAGNPAADFTSGELYTRTDSHPDSDTWTRLAAGVASPHRNGAINANDLTYDDLSFDKHSLP